MTVQWAAVLISALVFIFSAAVSTAIVIARVNAQSVTNHDEQQQNRAMLKELAGAVGELAKAAAVNGAQHDELSRRISSVERALGEHGEQIRRLRTTAHLHANKLMEIDPNWKPYRNLED